MSYRIIKVDMPVIISAHEFADDEGNPIAPGSGNELWLKQTAEQTIDGIRRYYYSALSPHRILIITRTGSPLQPNQRHWKALIGWDEGDSRFTLPTDQNKRHTKITIDEFLDRSTGPTIKLSEIIKKAPRSNRAGGWLSNVGRPELRPGDPTESHTITLPKSYWDLANKLGDGTWSKGIRALIEIAKDHIDTNDHTSQ